MTTDAGGHLFVVNGDLTKLACDAILLPEDDEGMVSGHWFELFKDAGPRPERYGPLPINPQVKARKHGALESQPVVGRVDTVSGSDIDAMVKRVVDAIETLGTQLKEPSDAGRALPLIAFPLPGTGEGLFGSRRGAVIQRLMAALAARATSSTYDVALVLRPRADYTAVQSVRPDDSWGTLTDEECREADRLGQLAARGGLSLFVGAGVSQALGLPGWKQLVGALLNAAEGRTKDGAEPTLPFRRPQNWEQDLLSAAEAARDALPDGRFEDLLTAQLNTDHAALSHALLAGLGLQRSVTTNFDGGFEIAHRGAHGDGSLRVMAAEWAATDQPWLLKLHGDLTKPASIVLTESQYNKDEDRKPLYGLVQGLLMTSHLLFVGFSMTDRAFVELAQGVDTLFRNANDTSPSPQLATVLSLTPLIDEEQWSLGRTDAVTAIAMGVDDRAGTAVLARRLEIFLDRVTWAAARSGSDALGYLLAPRYEGLLNREQVDVRAALLAAAETIDKLPAGDPARARLEATLVSMGRPSPSDGGSALARKREVLG